MQLTSVKAAEPQVEEGFGWQARSNEPVQTHGASRDERTLELCDGMIDITAALFSVSGKELRRAGRSSLGVTRVRQIAMYVAHVILRMKMTDIGRGFGRDRTTVVYACHLVEDMRDDEDFDRVIALTERLALAAFRNRLDV